MIVIDEEHESTFKQETAPRYHARDVAVKRAQLERVPVLLGSATPSLESWQNSERRRYTRLVMPNRVEGRPMPAVDVIDLRHEKQLLGGLSETLRQAMHRALDEEGQVILLLNRRGYHTFVVCPRCGYVVKCHSCDVAVTYHRGRHILICHTCDAERPCPPACPACAAPCLHYGGIGTERSGARGPGNVSEPRLPQDGLRLDAQARQSRGGPGGLQGRQGAHSAGHPDDRQGTRFPQRDARGGGQRRHGAAPAGLCAAERTFQLVAQVAGRTGRGDRPGRVLVQTYCPDHPAIRHAVLHDYEGFVRGELPERTKFGVPPFGRMVRLIARGPEEAAVSDFMKKLAAGLCQAAPASVRILGPAPAPIIKIRNLYRFHLQARCPSARPLQSLMREVPGRYPTPQGIELAVDVDPISML